MTSRIVISNVYSDDNRGGAAITAAAIEAAYLVSPNCDVTLITTTQHKTEVPRSHRHTIAKHPEVEILPAAVPPTTERLGGLRSVIRSLAYLIRPTSASDLPALRRVAEADLIVGKGGQTFSSRFNLRSLLGFWLTAFPLLYAHRIGVPTALYSVTLGPYPSRNATRWLAGWVLRRIDLIMVRDPMSLEVARSLGVKTENLIEIPDSVLAFQPPGQDQVASMAKRLSLEGHAFAVVTVTSSSQERDTRLFDKYDAILRPLLDDKTIDTVLAVLQTDGDSTSDRPATEAFIRHIADERVRLVDIDLSPSELMALYQSARFVVGGRIHSAIFALLVGTPAFPIQRDGTHKAGNIFRSLRLEDCIVRIDETTPDEIVNNIRISLSPGDGLRERIKLAVDSRRAEITSAVDHLRTLIEARPGSSEST